MTSGLRTPRRSIGAGTAGDRVTLVVDDPLAVAERCWDAGFEVRVCGPPDATTIIVIDPFGRELEVISSTNIIGGG